MIRVIGAATSLIFLTAALLPAQKPLTFDAASLRALKNSEGSYHYNVYPNRLDVKDMNLICDAFDLPDFRLSGQDSLGQHHFDIAATTSKPVARADMRIMLQNLLIERFHLATHWDTKTESVLRLEAMPGEPKMQTLETGCAAPNSPTYGSGTFHFIGPMSMRQLSESLTRFGSKPVLDATNLDGYFKIDLTFASENPMESSDVSSAPFLMKAVQEQLGLKLTPTREAIKILVVDHADDVPTES